MKKNIISLTVYLFFFSSTPIFCQSFSDLIIDTVYNHYRDSIVEDFCHTLSNFNGEKYDFFSYSIVYLSTMEATFIKQGDIVDTSSFTKEFFCSGQFVTDYIQKGISKGGMFKFVYKDYIYDINNKRCYDIPISWLTKRDKENLSFNPNKYLQYETFQENFYSCIGELLYKGSLDCVFAYPTRVDLVCCEDIIFHPYPILWGIKDSKFYVLDPNWTTEWEDNKPLIYTAEDFIDCCWDRISNVKLK